GFSPRREPLWEESEVLLRVSRAVEGNLFCVALAATNDLVSLHVFTRHDSQRIARDSFRVKLRLNLGLQLVARFQGYTHRGGGRQTGGLWREAGGRCLRTLVLK